MVEGDILDPTIDRETKKPISTHLLHVLVGLGHLREVVIRPLRRHFHALQPGQALEDRSLRLSIETHLPLEVVVHRITGCGSFGSRGFFLELRGFETSIL